MDKLSRLASEMTDGFLLGLRYESAEVKAFWRSQWFAHLYALTPDLSPQRLIAYYRSVNWAATPEPHLFTSVQTALVQPSTHLPPTGPKSDFDNGLFPFLRLVPAALASYAQYGVYAGENRQAIAEVLQLITVTHSSLREQISGLLFWRLLLGLIARRLQHDAPLDFLDRQALVGETFTSVNDYFSGYQHQSVLRYFSHLFMATTEDGNEIMQGRVNPVNANLLKAGDYCLDFVTTVFNLLYFAEDEIAYMKLRAHIKEVIPLAQGLLGMLNRLGFLSQPPMVLDKEEQAVLVKFSEVQTTNFNHFALKIADEWRSGVVNYDQYLVLIRLENERRGLTLDA